MTRIFRRTRPEEYLHVLPPNWQIVGAHDYGDGDVSLLLEHVPEVGQKSDERDDARGGDE
jgi:hypothetical protein